MSGEVSLPPPFDPFLSLRCGKTPPHWGGCLLSQRCPQTGPGHHSTWRLGTADQPLTQATAEDRVGQVWSANFLPCAPAQVAAWPCPSELFCGWPRAMLTGAGARGEGGVLTLGLPPTYPNPAGVLVHFPQTGTSAAQLSRQHVSLAGAAEAEPVGPSLASRP